MAPAVTTQTFDEEVLQSETPVLVDFWAEWCGPCHAVSPVLDRIAEEHEVKLVKVNIDEQQDLAQRYGVASIPFMVLFENGEPQASAIGAMPKGSLEKALGLAAGGAPGPPLAPPATRRPTGRRTRAASARTPRSSPRGRRSHRGLRARRPGRRRSRSPSPR